MIQGLLLLLLPIAGAIRDYPHGLGGARLDILCSPTEAAPGGVVNIQVSYAMDIVRPVDLHFDVLQEPQKLWLAGSMAHLGSDNNGSLSINLTLPHTIPDSSSLLWKVFVAPDGQRFPNMLAETGIALPVGDRVSGQCPFLPHRSSVHIDNRVDFVLINRTSAGFSVAHGLVSVEKAHLDIAVMDEATNLWLWGLPSLVVDKGIGKNMIGELPFFPMSVYLDVSLIPLGGSWESRLAEDRIYLS